MVLRWLVISGTLTYMMSCTKFETDAVRENMEQGKTKYEEFKAQANNDNTGPCWSNAIQV